MRGSKRFVSNSARRPGGALLGLAGGLCATLLCPLAGAQTTPIANDSAQGEARLDPDSIGVPGFGVVVEGAAEAQIVTGRVALRYGQFALDATLSGGSRDTATGRSQLFDALDTRPSGAVTVGVTWSSFRIRDYDAVFDQIEKLCLEQAAEDEAKLRQALSDDDDYVAAQERVSARTAEKTAAEGRYAGLAQALGEAIKAVDDARRAEDAALAKAEKARQTVREAANARVEGKTEKERASDEALRRTRVADAQLDLDAATLEATLTAQHTTAARVDAALAEARAVEAKRAMDLAESAAKESEAALDAERRRVTAAHPTVCAQSTLSETRRGRVVWPFHPTYIAAVRAGVSNKETAFFDPETTVKSRETAHPWKVSAGAGVFLRPTLLVATSLSYARSRVGGSDVSLCEEQPVGTETRVPYYACQDITVDVPTWSQSTALRFEARQYLTSELSMNPSFTYAWTGTETAPFAPPQGAWVLEVPLYVKASFGAEDDKAIVIGASYSHGSTWGLSENETRDNVALFLGGGFDIGRL